MDLYLGTDTAVLVTLSERNLRDLLRQFDKFRAADLRRLTDEGFLVIQVEENDRHYGDREPGPGCFAATEPQHRRIIDVLGFEAS